MLVLTGCVNPIEELAKGAIEKIIEDQIGGNFELDPNGDGFIIKTEDGDVHIGAGSRLPSDFPSGVPLPDGQLFGSAAVQGGWTLTYQGVDQRAMDDYLSRLKAAGFAEEATVDGADGAQGSLQSAQWGLVFFRAGDTLVLSVNPRD